MRTSYDMIFKYVNFPSLVTMNYFGINWIINKFIIFVCVVKFIKEKWDFKHWRYEENEEDCINHCYYMEGL